MIGRILEVTIVAVVGGCALKAEIDKIPADTVAKKHNKVIIGLAAVALVGVALKSFRGE